MKNRMKLISLAPTQTEIIAALGMLEDTIGVTEDCDYPEAAKKIPRFGSWYSPDVGAVVEARPDLVFTFGSHQEEIRELLENAGIRVFHSEPPTIAAALESFRQIAALVDRQRQSQRLVASLEQRLGCIRGARESAARQTTPPFCKGGRGGFYTTANIRPLVLRIMNWDPLVAPGPGAFQHDVIEFAGGSSVTGDGPMPYFVCDPEQVRARNPDIIFFCEPSIRTFLKEDRKWQSVNAVRQGRLLVYDCGLTCRSGPRIVDMAEELSRAVLDVKSSK